MTDSWSTVDGENALHQAGQLPLSPRLNYVHRAYRTWNGYVDNHLKSAIQKLIRRSSNSEVERALKAFAEGQLWPLVYFVIELDLFKTVTFPGPLANAYIASKAPNKPLSDGIRTNLENRLRVISLEDIGMANPLLCAAIEQALPLTKVKVRSQKDSTSQKEVNADRPKELLQVVISQAASPKCRLYSHLKTLFALPPYYWDSTHDKSVKGEKVHEKADRLRKLWFALVPHVQGVEYPAELPTLHTKPEVELKEAFVQAVKHKQIEAFAYLSAAIFGVYTSQGTRVYDPKAKLDKGLVSSLAFKLLLTFCEAALSKVKDELNDDVKKTIRVMKLWFKKMTHAEKPLYLYHAIAMMVFRDDLATATIPDLIPLSDKQTSILYKANLATPPPAAGVPLAIPLVAQDVHTSSKGKKDKDIVDFAMTGSYVAVPSSARGCGNDQWQDVYKVYKMGQVAAKELTDDAARDLLSLVKPFRNKDLTEDETKTLKQKIKTVLDPLASSVGSRDRSHDRSHDGRRKSEKRSRDGTRVKARKSRTLQSRNPQKRVTKQATKRLKVAKCVLDQTQLEALMASKPGAPLFFISSTTEMGKQVKSVIDERLLAQSRCGKAKLFTLVGKDLIVKGPLGFKSPKKLVLNVGLNVLLKQLEDDSGLGNEWMGGIMPHGLYRNDEGLWIVWPNVGPTYDKNELTVKTTKVDSDYKVVDRDKKDIRMSTIAKTKDSHTMTPVEAKATLQHLYWRSILMAGDSGAHNVIRTYKGERPIGGIDMEEIRGASSLDTDDPWLILFKSNPDKKQKEAFSPYLNDIVKMDRLSPAFLALADKLATIAPHCGLEPGHVYRARLEHVNKVLFNGLSSLTLSHTTKTTSRRIRAKPIRVGHVNRVNRSRSRSVSPSSRSRPSKSRRTVPQPDRRQASITEFTPLAKDRVKIVP